MNVNGIGAAGYPAWQGARKAESSTKGGFCSKCAGSKKCSTY